MAAEDMQDHIRNSTRNSIYRVLNPQIEEREGDQLDESLVGVGAAIVGAGAAQAYIRKIRRARKADKSMNKFIEEYDTTNIIEEKIPELLRRFKLINSLADLEKMENIVDKYISQINTMIDKVDNFVERGSDKKTISDRALFTNPVKEKKRLKKQMNAYLKETRDAFKKNIEAKKDELLS